MQVQAETPVPPALLTIPQVAEYLGVCRAHVYTLIHQGLPVIHLGRRVFVHPSSLQRWLMEQEQVSRDS